MEIKDFNLCSEIMSRTSFYVHINPKKWALFCRAIAPSLLSKGSWPYVDLLDSMYQIAQKLTRHDDSIYLVIWKMMHDFE